jgi:hypothetical protein
MDLRACRRDQGCALGGDLGRRFPETLAAPEHPEVGDNSFIATAESADEVGPLMALIDRVPSPRSSIPASTSISRCRFSERYL